MAADNTHSNYEVLPGGPCRRATAITPHDSDELTFMTRFIYVGGAGNVVLVTEYGEEVTFSAVPAGTILPVAAKMVKTASSASDMVAMA